MKKINNVLKHFRIGIASAIVLLSVIVIFTAFTINTKDTSLALILAERGNVLISLFERSLIGNQHGRTDFELQKMAEVLHKGEGVEFVVLTNSKGEILAHSNAEKVGKILQVNGHDLDEETIVELGINTDPAWTLLEIEGEYVFAVYKELIVLDQRTRMHERMLSRMMQSTIKKPYDVESHHNNVLDGPDKLYAFVGQDIGLYTQTKTHTRSMAIAGGSLVLIASLAALLALQYAMSGKESRKRQKEAEALAAQMIVKVKELEKDLRQKEKLAAVGDLAAGVAHELRNPLSSIKGYATYFSQLFPQGSLNKEAAQTMVQEVDRLNRSISDLIGVTKVSDIRPQEVNILDLCKSIFLLLEQDAIQKNVKLQIDADSSLQYKAFVDPDRMRQALLNICLNALEVLVEDNKEGSLVLLSISHARNNIIIKIKDNAHGISQEILERVFDPYFTTKAQGTGLGLVMARNILEAHQGSIEVQSSEEGSVFILTFPSSLSTRS